MEKKVFKNFVQISHVTSQGYPSGGRNLIHWRRTRLLRVYWSNVKELYFFIDSYKYFCFCSDLNLLLRRLENRVYICKNNTTSKQNKHAKKTIAIKIKKNIYTKKRRKYFYFSINILQCNSITVSSMIYKVLSPIFSYLELKI